ncbi:Transglutaminase-like superfamily [Geosmithia morbida]|uniref:Transglutaminase-like superfamily n=1 Tax=Geosmithia morbida TaxID=1094350 RepID=A0A9P4Z0J1_9HYPO|nr:Transglutaminase-like superfamily [Geosmithia morbida]KAF4126471.1 Transglutaminase-like superfamily [Geosmithia morbida]
MADMADDEPQFSSLKERIAALNQQKNFVGGGPESQKPKTVSSKPTPRARPPPPPTPSAHIAPATPSQQQRPPPLPRRDTQGSQSDAGSVKGNGAPPPLPSRTATAPPPMPERPVRGPSQQNLTTANGGRRGSASSGMSSVSTLSQTQTISSVTSHGSEGRRLPPPLSQANLPPLPPTRRELAAAGNDDGPAVASQSSSPALPPRLPARPDAAERTASTGGTGAAQTTLKAASIRGFGSGKSATTNPPQTQPQGDTPPPVPMGTRPSAAQIDTAYKRATNGQPSALDECWVCKDWSGPDGVAAQFPRSTLPRGDPVGHLARGLCGPFPSYTDKARAIFTWFYHNIRYDTVAFFGNNVRHMSVEETIFGGKAVCQGYAETYKAIANRAGLECVVISGHGKGFGHTPLKAGERAPPPKPDGHAWNAVGIDGGVWKLVDACWGAGHLCNGTYKQEFTPGHFIMTNDEFGESHFPRDPRMQYRDDGRVVSWEEYFVGPGVGETPVTYTNAKQEGILEKSIEPRSRQIPVYSGETVRFQFSKVCPHWRSDTHGLGPSPLLLLAVHGVDGRSDDMIPFNTDGYWHWLDVPARELGVPGQSLQVAQLTSVDGQDVRGVSAKEYLAKKRRLGMGWAFVVRWDLV